MKSSGWFCELLFPVGNSWFYGIITEIIYPAWCRISQPSSVYGVYSTPQKDAENTLETTRNYGVNITSWKHAPIFLKGLLVTLKIPKHHENSIVMTCIYNNTHIYTYTLLPLVFELLLSNRADYSN